MTTSFPFLSQHHWLISDDRMNPDRQDPSSALAYQDTYIRWLPKYNEAHPAPEGKVGYGVIHYYPIQTTSVLLGAKDTRLPNFKAACQHLVDLDYVLTLRPHGGLAVVNDPGVLNIGIASDNDRFSLSIDEAFEQMTQLIQLAVDPEGLSIESYEVVDSYCPGSYDIVINGKKVGGIAQRRFKTGLTTAAYLGVNGDQGARGEAIREFYRIGDGDDSYPTVNPDSMTTLSALTGQDLTVDDIIQRINSIVDDYSTWEVLPFDRSDLQEAYQPMLTKTQQKSATVQPENIDPAS